MQLVLGQPPLGVAAAGVISLLGEKSVGRDGRIMRRWTQTLRGVIGAAPRRRR